MPLKGFISYSHDDIAVCRALLKHLKPFDTKFGLTFHVDLRTSAGSLFDENINRWIEEASVHIMMISPHSMDSPAIMDWEWPAIFKKRRDRGDLVLPLVVRNCRWEVIAGTMQAAPLGKDNRVKPVTKWSPHSEGLYQACLEFEQAIADHIEAAANPVPPAGSGA